MPRRQDNFSDNSFKYRIFGKNEVPYLSDNYRWNGYIKPLKTILKKILDYFCHE
jgi:hypothetical protein